MTRAAATLVAQHIYSSLWLCLVFPTVPGNSRRPAPISRCMLDCYWVGSLDFNFLVEIKLNFPLNPQKVIHFLQRGQQPPSINVELHVLHRWPRLRAQVGRRTSDDLATLRVATKIQAVPTSLFVLRPTLINTTYGLFGFGLHH